MSDASYVSERAAELRRDFDHAFAEPIRSDIASKEILLGIRVGGQPYALRLAEAAGVHASKKITPVPGSSPALRGIAGFRGVLLPVFDLHILLSHSNGEAPRWLVVASAAPVALTFSAFEGQLRVSPDEILPRSAGSETVSYARELVRTKNFVGPILHLPSILDAIKASGAGLASTEE
jgi:purine-binding chemotaxis protein CheW